MPIYEYKCEECGKITNLSRWVENRFDPVECSECGGNTDKIPTYADKLIGVAIGITTKQSSCRSEVHFGVDDTQTIYKKQLKIEAKREKPKGLTQAQWDRSLMIHKKRAENTRPKKVV